MKRPKLIHFTCVQTQSKFSIRASVNYLTSSGPLNKDQLDENTKLSSPFESIGLLKAQEFRIKIIGLNKDHQVIFKKIFESDGYGDFDLRIPIKTNEHEITSFQIYEVSALNSVELLLGTRIPIKINYPKKVIISDFDKTLVDTRYSTAIEVYESLRKPINHFPRIEPSIELLKESIEKGFQPFILTASPHFYENAIRDWLYQNKIYTAAIFLKDYRKIISLMDGLLTTKDLKSQGFYKLNHLVSILLMTGIPEELILVGDGFESDPLIYALLGKILKNDLAPWEVWGQVKNVKAFRLNRKQDSQFLNRLYQLNNEIIKNDYSCKLNIHIRKPEHIQIKPLSLPFLDQQFNKIQFYET